MKHRMRKALGLCVGCLYALLGARCRAIRRLECAEGILSVFGHNPHPEVLASLVEWLVHKGFSFVSTDELLEMQAGQVAWRPRLAWLTFDDGWAGFEEQLLPILERWQVPATIFVAPEETRRGQIWTNSVMGAVPAETFSAWYDLPAEARYRKVDEVLGHIGNPRRLADEAELRRLAKHPLMTLENHTWSHLSCSHRPVEEVVAEVQETQKALTEWTGRVPKLCCYPFGHCTEETDEALRTMGLLPVHSQPGVMTLGTLGLCRNMFTETMSAQENIGRVLGAWPKVKARTK